MGPVTQSKEPQFELTGGALCLDFANTLGGRKVALIEEHLTSYLDLLAWARQAGVLHGSDVKLLKEAAENSKARLNSVLQKARELREAIYRVFSAVAAEGRPEEEDLALINEVLVQALRHSRIVATEDGYSRTWDEPRGNDLESPLWPVAHSAAELLTSSEIRRVRECASDTCAWLFVDRSKNRTRRWCDMKICGNREKARRHYERARS
jgi:predicted RNA-binding Zn ribbon-like protein